MFVCTVKEQMERRERTPEQKSEEHVWFLSSFMHTGEKRRKNWSEILFYKKEIVEEKGKYNNDLYMTGHSHTGITDVKLRGSI